MRKRGEITVFLSLTLVCVLSLFMGLLESARTAGARLYLNMAVNSAMASLMSQYNRNLWDMYHLLFLEYESEQAIKSSFDSYLDFYLEQENFYPAKRERTELKGIVTMTQNEGRALEDGILSCMKYRLPETAADLAGISAKAAEASKAGNFRTLLDVCRQAGKETRRLERARCALEDALEDMRELKEKAAAAAEDEREGRFENYAGKLEKKIGQFPGLLEKYEDEVTRLSADREERAGDGTEHEMDAEASGNMRMELDAYKNVETAAKKQLSDYQEMGHMLEDSREYLDEALQFLDGNGGEEDEAEEETEWDAIRECMEQVQIPESAFSGSADKEKSAALDRLEEVLSGDLLKLVIPEGTVLSEKRVSLKDTPSVGKGPEKNGAEEGTQMQSPAERFLTVEYILLYFDSFLDPCSGRGEVEGQALSYEQEYLLCGKASDRENLSEAVEQLLMMRGAMNLLYLIRSPEKREQADGLALAVSGGNVPVQFIVSFFILSLWALGEAVGDVRELMDGGSVPFEKDDESWRLSLEGLLSLDFPDGKAEGVRDGSGYEDYLRILLFLKDRALRNYRIMDVIQWNVRTKQGDFKAEDCAFQVEIHTEAVQRHRFFVKNEYESTADAVWSY